MLQKNKISFSNCLGDNFPIVVNMIPIPPNRSFAICFPDPKYVIKINFGTIANQPSVFWASNSNNKTMIGACFLTPDNKYKINTFAFHVGENIDPINQQVFQIILSSFAFK